MLRDLNYVKIYHKIVLICFILSTIIQLYFIFFINNQQLKYDAAGYFEIGTNLFKKWEFCLNDKITFRRTPMYPLYIAIIDLVFPNNVIAVKLSQILIVNLSFFLLLKLHNLMSKNIFEKYLLLLFYFFFPILITLSSQIITEGLSVFFMILSIYYLIKNKDNLNVNKLILAGVLFGLLSLTRPINILLPFFIIPFFFTKKYSVFIKKVSVFVLAYLLTIGVWTYRNYHHSGCFIPLSVGGEIELWAGSYLPFKANMDHPLKNVKKKELFEKFSKMHNNDEILVHREFSNEAKKNIMNNPMGYISLIPIKILRLFVGSHSARFNIATPMMDFIKNPYLLLEFDRLMVFVIKIWILMASIIVVALTILFPFINRSYFNRGFFLFYLVIGYYIFMGVITLPISRYSISIIPMMLILASLCFNRIVTCNLLKKSITEKS